MSALSLARQAAAVSDISEMVKSTEWPPNEKTVKAMAAKLGRVAVKREGDLYQFNYTADAQYAKDDWTDYEQVCRGLVVHRSGLVYGWPFEKFWNWGEGGRTSDAAITAVYEKLDGSLGIGFYDFDECQWRVVTHGSFASPQALWATEWLREHMPCDVLYSVTLLFEIVYPDNRIVVDYGQREELVLLAARASDDGVYWEDGRLDMLAELNNWTRPQRFDIDTLDDIERAISAGDRRGDEWEGFVALMADGSRWKFKTGQYREMHRYIDKMTARHAIQAVADGRHRDIMAMLPERMKDTWWALCVDAADEMHRRLDEVLSVWGSWCPTVDDGRKEFAAWATARQWLSSYLFALYDGKDIRPMIYKAMEKEA